MKPNLSISLIKSLRAIDLNEACAARIKAIQIDKIYDPSLVEEQSAMKLGQYIEYVLTGAKLRDGSIPQAKTTKTGLAAEYARVEAYKPIWEDELKINNFTEIVTSLQMEYDYMGNNLKCIADVTCKQGEKHVIIDIKSTGFIDNKWEKYGWVEIEKKPEIYAQAVFYVYLYFKLFGVIPDFYFSVFSTGTKPHAKLLKIIIPFDIDEICSKVEHSVDYALSLLEYQNAIGWPSSQNYAHCLDCGWAACDKRLKSPKIQVVELFNIKF
jgi:hypothetical protein